VLSSEKLKLIEEIIGDKEKARRVAEIIDETVENGLKAIEEKAKEQKAVVKAELKDELRKELATKEDIALTKEELKQEIGVVKQEIEVVRQEIKVVRQEIETVRQELKGDIKALRVIIYFLFVFVALLNKGTVEFIFKVLGILK